MTTHEAEITDLKNDYSRQFMIDTLWSIAAFPPEGVIEGLGHLTLEQRKHVAEELRATATLLESAPETMLGLLFVTASHAPSDDGEDKAMKHVAAIGHAPAIAASYLTIEGLGTEACNEVLPLVVQSLLKR